VSKAAVEGETIRFRMARPTAPPGPPPTLRYLAEQAAGIDAECRDCRHRVVLWVSRKFLLAMATVPFPDFARLMKCSACGSRTSK
jgi:hypothetical protein